MMINYESIVRGQGEKLADEIYSSLADCGECKGWRLLFEAKFCVHIQEWTEISRVAAVASIGRDITENEWLQEKTHEKLLYLEKLLKAMDEASRLIRNSEDAAGFLDRFIRPPLGLYLDEEASDRVFAGAVPVVVLTWVLF